MEADGRVVRLSQALRSVKLRLDRLVRPDGISKGGREETSNRTREWLDLEWKSRSQLISRGDIANCERGVKAPCKHRPTL